MRLINHLYLIVLIFSVVFAQEPDNSKITAMLYNIEWFGQASIKISTGKSIIYIDPFRIKVKDAADIILITHDHRDHLDPASIANLLTEKTVIIAPSSCKEKIEELQATQTRFLNVGDFINVKNIRIEAVSAYNLKKKQYHPKSKNYLGYILTTNGIRIYHAGDTERIPEMKNIHCDIAMMPLGQKFTMNSVEEAAEAILDVKAKVVIPIHWGLYEGSSEDVELLKKILANKVEVITPPDLSSKDK